MKLISPLRLVATAVASALALAACSGSDGDSGEAEGAETAAGGTYSTAFLEPSALGPASNCYESECFTILNLITEPLVLVDFESGGLAFDGMLESLESEDNKTWTLKIKDGYTFHDGEPVTAESFVRAWEFSADPENAQQTAGFLSKIERGASGELTGVTAVDAQTLEVTLTEPFSQFGQTMAYTPAFAPMAQACLDDPTACNEEPIGTGPYMMDGLWEHDEAITVTRYPDYPGGVAAVADTIEFQMFTDPTAAFRDFQNGGVDVINLAPQIYPEAKGQLGDAIIEEPTSNLIYLGFPTTQAPFDRVEVRRAISMSIDREQIADKVLNGLPHPSTDIVPPPIPGSRDDACAYCVHDPDRAKALLEESEVDPAGVRIEYFFPADSGFDQWVEAAARQVQDTLGFDYALRSMDWAKYLNVLGTKTITGPFSLGWAHDYPAMENYLRPTVSSLGSSNYSGYANAEVDRKLVEGDRAAGIGDAISLYQEAGDRALEDLPIIPLWSGSTAIAFSDQVGDVRYSQEFSQIAYNEVSVNR